MSFLNLFINVFNRNFAGVFFFVCFSNTLNDNFFFRCSRGILMSKDHGQLIELNMDVGVPFIFIRSRTLIMGNIILTERFVLNQIVN